MRFEDRVLDAQIRDDIERNILGVLEPDQPTAISHFLYMARRERMARAEFSPAEREHIRLALGLPPFESA